MIKFLFLLVVITFNLLAHQTALSYISLKETKDQKIDVIYKKPLEDIEAKNLLINFPSSCQKELLEFTEIENGFIIYSYSLLCTKKLKNNYIWIEGLKPLNRGVIIDYENDSMQKKALLKAESPYFYIEDNRSISRLIIEYIKLGIEHILSGYDHLLFVLALMLIAKDIKMLVIAVSAFTISHSITLISAVYNFLTLPILYVEAMIALSIVFLARELFSTNNNTLTKKHLEYIAFIFGLLHGFGFSNVLKEIGLPQDDIVLALFSFNLGIEIGQLLFILVMYYIFSLGKKYFIKGERFWLTLLAYLIGGLSMFWFLQRLASF